MESDEWVRAGEGDIADSQRTLLHALCLNEYWLQELSICVKIFLTKQSRATLMSTSSQEGFQGRVQRRQSCTPPQAAHWKDERQQARLRTWKIVTYCKKRMLNVRAIERFSRGTERFWLLSPQRDSNIDRTVTWASCSSWTCFQSCPTCRKKAPYLLVSASDITAMPLGYPGLRACLCICSDISLNTYHRNSSLASADSITAADLTVTELLSLLFTKNSWPLHRCKVAKQGKMHSRLIWSMVRWHPFHGDKNIYIINIIIYLYSNIKSNLGVSNERLH